MKRYIDCKHLIVSLALGILSIGIPLGAEDADITKSTYSTIEEFEAQYPPFKETEIKKEATKIAEKNINPVKIGDEVTVFPKNGNSVKGNFYGLTSSNGVKVSGVTIPWMDLSDKDKIRFSSDMNVPREKFIAEYVLEKRREYLKERASNRDEVIKGLADKNPDIFLKRDGSLLYKVKIISTNESAVTLEHSKGNGTIQYAELEPASLAKIDSSGVLNTESGKTYEGVKVLKKDADKVLFLCDGMKMVELKASNLANESLVKLGLSVKVQPNSVVSQKPTPTTTGTKAVDSERGNSPQARRNYLLAKQNEFGEPMKQFVKAYEDNKINFMAEWLGKEVKLIGRISDINIDNEGNAYIAVDSYMHNSVCFKVLMPVDEIKKLSKRKVIGIIGDLTNVKDTDGNGHIFLITNGKNVFYE